MFLSVYQQTPLHIAATEDHDYTVKCLVEKTADVNIKDMNGVCVTTLLIVDEYC